MNGFPKEGNIVIEPAPRNHEGWSVRCHEVPWGRGARAHARTIAEVLTLVEHFIGASLAHRSRAVSDCPMCRKMKKQHDAKVARRGKKAESSAARGMCVVTCDHAAGFCHAPEV